MRIYWNAASDYANAAYFANVDENYEFALQYIDSAILLLNEHYEKYARPDRPHRYMKLVGGRNACRNQLVERIV